MKINTVYCTTYAARRLARYVINTYIQNSRFSHEAKLNDVIRYVGPFAVNEQTVTKNANSHYVKMREKNHQYLPL